MEVPPEGFELIPPDDEETPEAALDGAEASALEDPEDWVSEPEVPPLPFGRTWLFDFETGRLVRAGQSPMEVTGLRALAVWCLMAIHTARYAHAVFTPAFGMEEPDGVIGEVDGAELVDDFGARIRAALLPHDRISDVEAYDAEYLADEGVLYILNLTVVTDEEERLRFRDISLTTIPGGV